MIQNAAAFIAVEHHDGARPLLLPFNWPERPLTFEH